MRKRLSLSLVLVLGLVGCNSYGSLYEANRACNEWADDEKIEFIEWEVRYVKKTLSAGRRLCIEEERTSQVIGIQSVYDEDSSDVNKKTRDKIVTRFRY